MKYITLSLLTFIAVNLSALQIIIDDWHNDNQWTGKVANGASPQFYTSQNFTGVDGINPIRSRRLQCFRW